MAIKTRQQPEQETEAPQARHPLTDAVGDGVIRALGTPPRFLKVKTVHLFDNRFRVNVYQQVQTEFECLIKKCQIVDSFFCIADEKGAVVSPRIERKYP